MSVKFIWEKLLAALRAKSQIGGLEISDAAMRFIYLDGQEWKMIILRLPPGIIEKGQIKNREKFVEAAKNLRAHIPVKIGRHEKFTAVVALNSVNVYSQVFSLPLLEGENLNQAIQLNIQMVSPIETSQAYSGWQLVNQDQNALRLEILSAFINRQIVDEISSSLKEAGFLPVAIESRALSLMRLIRKEATGFNVNSSYIILNLDNVGLDFVIARRGQLYFEYFTPWQDLEDEKGQISVPAFQATVLRNLHQVVTFYGQHWQEPLTEILVSAIGLNREIEKIINDNFSLKVTEVKLKIPQTIGPDWFVALGAGLRGLTSRKDDKEISLLGFGVEEEFHEEQIINFMNFWRITIPVTMAAIVVVFAVADIFLLNMRRNLESRMLLSTTSEQRKKINDLQIKVSDFNRSVVLIQTAEKSATPYKSRIVDEINNLMKTNGLALGRFHFQSPDTPANLTGYAQSEDQILNFKKILDADSRFRNIDLPLTDIKSSPPHGLSFSINFLISPNAFSKTQ